MELNLDIICDHLPKSYKVQRFGPVYRRRSLKLPVLYEAGCAFEKDRLYVARAETLPRTPPQKGLTVICVDFRPPQEWVDKGCQVLLILNGPSLFSVFNEINKIYEKFIKWDTCLRNELEAGVDFDIKQFLISGMLMLENPLAVINGTLVKIFSSEMVPHEGSDGFDILVSDEYRPVQDIESVKNACRLERVIKEPYITSVTYDGKRTYCNNIYPFGYFAGCISLTEFHRPFRDSDFSLADHFFGYFQKAYSIYLRSIPHSEQPGFTALINLLGGVPLSEREQELFALEPGEYWTCFKLKNIQTINSLPLESMCATLNTLMIGIVTAVIYNEEILGLLKLRQDENGSHIIEFFERYLNKTGYIAGLSDKFFDINQTHVNIKLADYAVEMGSQKLSGAHICCFPDFALQYIMTRYTGVFSPEYLYPKGFLSLIEHDKNTSTNYIKTLDVYLKNEMKISDTANELFLHRSSLLSRLGRIGKILDVDIKDPEVRLFLRVCLYLFHQAARG